MKTIASIEEIRAEIQRRISASEWASGYGADCEAPIPWRTSHDGVANWTAQTAPTAKRGCEGFLLDIVASVRQDYDLPPQSLSDAVASLLGGRNSPF
jgi:hypothetical protein